MINIHYNFNLIYKFINIGSNRLHSLQSVYLLLIKFEFYVLSHYGGSLIKLIQAPRVLLF